jgi:CNT family concentrative nucleoside transporter
MIAPVRQLLIAAVIFFAGSFIPHSMYASDTAALSDTLSLVTEDTVTSSARVLFDNEAGAKVNKGNIIPARQEFRFSLGNILRGLLGIAVILLISWLLSDNRRKVSWKVVGVGLAAQILLAVGVLQVPFVQHFFEFGGKLFVKVLDFTKAGTEFLFESMASGTIEPPLQTFAITILPTIIFFSALSSVLFYFGIIQKVVWVLAWLMTRGLKLSGAESLAVAGNIFLGQTESPLMIKAYLEKMSRSEMFLVMSAGMATLAGGVLAVYINFLGGDDPVQRLQFAKHLLAASVMAAPGVVIISKILVPPEGKVSQDVKISQEKIGRNVLDAINNGTYEGLKLAVNVAAMLLVFIAFIAMINYIFIKVGGWTHLNGWVAEISSGRYHELSLQFILGYSLSPLMWLIGVSSQDITLVGSLLGEKLIMTEFVGYISLSEMKEAGRFADPKSIIMATYMLCGFANFASVGIQIGGIGAIAPGQRQVLTRYGMKALIAGTLASLLSATIVGVILS